MRAKERFQLRIYFVRREWLTHYHDGKEWVRGTTEGRVTNLFTSAVKGYRYELIPLIPLNRLAKSLGYEKGSALMLQLARYYAVPLVPLAISEKRRVWCVVPCYGFFQFLKEEFNLGLDQIQLVVYVDITGMSDKGKRLVLAGLVKHNASFDKIGKIVCVPYEVLQACYNLDQVEMSKWSLRTVLAKGFKALLRKRPFTQVRNEWNGRTSEAIVKYLGKTRIDEAEDLRTKVKSLFGDNIEEFLDGMERLISAAFIDTSDDLQRSYIRLHADGPANAERNSGEWWDTKTETINPMFAICYEARRRVLCNIFRRAKLTENYIKIYPKYWSPKPNSLLTRALNASYRRLLDKNEELFRKMREKQIECVRVVASVLKEKVLHIPIPKDAIEQLKSKLKSGEETVKIFLRWTYEFFGFNGLKAMVYGDKKATETVHELAWDKFRWLEKEFTEFFRTLFNATRPAWTFYIPDY
jgi:hypothetical protein